jgi:uncharacterized protein (TIGR03545 family)
MRKKFLYFVLVPLLVLLVTLYFFLDSWIESGLETAGESLVGAKCEIDYLKVSVFPPGIRFIRLQVADPDDPWKNLFETGQVEFSMDFGQLLRGKYIIETMEVNDLILGTKRTSDGSLPGGRKKSGTAAAGPNFTDMVQEILDKTVERTPLFDPSMLRKGVNVDSLVKAQHFQTLMLIDSLRQSVSTAGQRWDSAVTDFEAGKKKLQGIEESLRTINPSSLKTPDQILAAITTVDQSYTTINQLTATFDARQKSVRGYFDNLSSAVGTIPRSIDQDYRKVLSLARLPDFNSLGLAELILGKQMLTQILQYARWADVARSHIASSSAKPEIETPPRMKGQNIRFPVERGFPKFWIKRIKISGGTDPKQNSGYIFARGEATNLSSDQRVTGVPLSIVLEGTRGGEVSFNLGALIDRTKDVPHDEYKVGATGVPLAAFEVGKTDFLPSKITNARLTSSITVTIAGSAFDARTKMHFANITMEFTREPSNIGERLAREVLKGVTGFDAELRLWKREGGVDVAFTSDLDAQFAARAREALGAELSRLQADLHARVDAAIAQQRQELESLYNTKKGEALQQLSGYGNLLTGVSGLADGKKKELLAQLEKQKKGTIDDVMKKLFKK